MRFEENLNDISWEELEKKLKKKKKKQKENCEKLKKHENFTEVQKTFEEGLKKRRVYVRWWWLK